MPVQPRFRVKFLLKFKYENVVRLAFQKKFYSKTRMDGHITIREKSVLRGARARFQSYIPCDFGHRKPDDFSPMTHFLSCRTSQQRPHWEQKQVPIVERWPLQRGLNKSQCMDCLPKKAAVVKRWLLWGGRGVIQQIFLRAYKMFVLSSYLLSLIIYGNQII